MTQTLYAVNDKCYAQAKIWAVITISRTEIDDFYVYLSRAVKEGVEFVLLYCNFPFPI